MAKSAGGHSTASAAGMAIIRLFLGAFFLYCGIDQLMHAGEFIGYFKGLSASHSVSAIPGIWAYYAGFVHAPVTAQTAALAGWTIIGLEILVGVLLVIGLLTRLAVLIPLIANLSFFYATHALTKEGMLLHSFWLNGAFFVMELAVLIAAAGRTWGLDAILARKTKVRILW